MQGALGKGKACKVHVGMVCKVHMGMRCEVH